VNAGVIAQAAGLFAVTNFDDIVVQSLFFAQGTGSTARHSVDHAAKAASIPYPPRVRLGIRVDDSLPVNDADGSWPSRV
jgi:hypothetical protein